jgi:DNA modification methylase
MDKGTLAVEWISIDRLFENPANPRHNDAAVPHVAASLSRFGWRQPIVAKPSGEIVAGHTRYKAAKTLGMDELPVVRFEGSDLDATAYGIADNRTAEFAEWDQPALAGLLEELRSEDSLDGVGYTGPDIDALLAEIRAGKDESLQDPGPGDPPSTPVSRAGDLWRLGTHQLLCGDSTCLEDVRRVIGAEQARLVATDPPYLVDYTGERPNNSGKDWSATYKEIDIKDADGFFTSVFTNVLEVLAPHGAIYCWHAHKRQALLSRVWEELGIVDHQQIVWVKPAAVFGRVYWHFRHEPCVMGWRKGSKPDHDGNHEFDSVWSVDYDGLGRRAADHPTAKPVELFARPMRKHTKPGDLCFEPFSGSGSQIMAAEQLGLRCRAIEIEPAFVDVAVVRWEQATGEKAILDGTSESFAETRARRES